MGFGGPFNFIKCLYNNPMSKEIKKSDILAWFADNIFDITVSKGSWMGDEIQRWIELHEDEIESYIILDDDDDFRDEQLFHFIQTDGYFGISEREIKLSIMRLNGERIPNPLKMNLEIITRWRNKCDGLDGKNIDTLLNEYYSEV